MSTIYGILFFLSLVMLIVGLKNPERLKNKKTGGVPSRKKIGLIIGAFSFILLLLLGITSPSSSTDQKSTTSNPTIEKQQVSNPTAQINNVQQATNTPTHSPTPTQKPTSTPTPTSIPTASPTATASPISDPYEIMSKIGKEVAGDNSNVSIFKNDDGSIDVINNIQLIPEITWGSDAYTRKWVTEFLSKSFTSDINIRYVLVTVSFLHTDIPATRVGLGINLAKVYTNEEWTKITPMGLCKWLQRIQDGDDTDPSDPNFDPSDWAFAKNYKCS